MKTNYLTKNLAFRILSLLLISFSTYAQVGIGNTNPRTTLDVNGALSLRTGGDFTLNAGVNNNVTFGTTPYSFYRVKAPSNSNFTINSIVTSSAGLTDGQIITLENNSTGTMTLAHNGGGTNRNKILCPGGQNIALSNRYATATLMYETNHNRWILISTNSVGGGIASDDWTTTGNAGTNPGTNFIGTTDDVDLVFKTNSSVNSNEKMRILSNGQVAINGAPVLAIDRFTSIGATDEFAIVGLSSGNNGVGVYGENTADGSGVFGVSSTGVGTIGTGPVGVGGYGGSLGVFGQVENDTGFGAFALNEGTNGTGLISIGNNTTGSYLISGSGISGTGDTGVYALSTSADGTGVIGVGNNNTTNILISPNGSGGAFSGTTTGVIGFGTDTGNTISGVFGQYSGGIDDGIGVYGLSDPTSGSSNWGIGVEGFGGQYGVHGIDASGSGYGVFSTGDFGGTGAKYFVIDHPNDPANKYLRHANIESNEILNLYRGTIMFDSSGRATVQLPEYYTSINKNASYQLTAIGAAMPNLFIEKEVSNSNTFVIAGGISGKKVSWILTAERNDPYLQQNPQKRQNIIDKGSRRGKYLMPELYGQPKEKGMHYKETSKPKKLQVKEVKKMNKIKDINRKEQSIDTGKKKTGNTDKSN